MMCKRRNKHTFPGAKVQRIAELGEWPVQALATIQKLQKQVDLLRAKAEELEGAGKRQAAPFGFRHSCSSLHQPLYQAFGAKQVLQSALWVKKVILLRIAFV